MDLASKLFNGNSQLTRQQQVLNQACLYLCIALLDYPLNSCINNSIIISFFAVLRIKVLGLKEELQITFHKLETYTTKLSAFVKIS
jgi:hypothetical protein